ncbi:gephyrin-like isoform X2 [Cataglyphis hispanica]|uniref:gephyrin-like isoform X2 n=1 Tax=Cataglyphis hispanica TaxID=1086592 RepID=UPI0021805C5E|nr:gephyrin-like isoform X2 [Cataglyphis hispanica]
MSTKVITFFIIVVGDKDKLKHYVHLMKEIISDDLEGYINDVHYTPCNLYQIQKYLESLCDANKANIVIIIGEHTKCKSAEENIVCMATKVAINHCKIIYKDITPDILELEVQLRDVLSQAVCGIRNNTFILNMFGMCLMATMCLRTHKEKILQIAQKIMQEKIDWLINAYKITSSSTVTVPQAILTIGSIVARELRHHRKSLIIPEYVSVHDAYGKILFENIYSKCNVPSVRVSAKQGFAIIVNDEKKTKKILEPGITSIQPGTCVMVNIGAPIPDRATAVIEIKNTKKVIKKYDNTDNKEYCEQEEIEILSHPKEEENIKPIGCEVKIEEPILNKNTCIGAADIGILTCCGIDKVAVIKHQSIGILSIGDELEKPGRILKPGHIYDSSKLILITLLKQHGFNALNLGIAKDNIISIIGKLEEILEKVNIIVIIGAAKDKDLLKPILRGHFNAVLHFGAVNMKPGRSTTYATCTFNSTTKHFLCLSKNSAIVPIAAHLFLLPLLNVSRCFHKEWPLVVSRIQLAPELYSRPKYVWTSLKWNKENTYPWIHNISNHYNHNTNALLRLPSRTMEMSKLLPDAFITTIFVGSR